MANSSLEHHIINEQAQQARKAHRQTILVEESTDEESTIVEDNKS
jgi:hypothetical protein